MNNKITIFEGQLNQYMTTTEQQRQIINNTEEKLNQYITLNEQQRQIISNMKGKLSKYIKSINQPLNFY